MGVVHNIQGKCKRCYSCIRNCPAKAIRIKDGQAEVIEERCIACGTCVKVCALNAKQVENDVVKVWQLLGEYSSVVAILSSSFPAAFPQVRPGQVVAALKKLGFSEVTEVAFGAELVGRAYHRMLRENGSRSLIFTACPAVVQYIEKYHPQLIDRLAPIVSPMIAMGRAIKKHYAPGARTVFIGPCIAKKGEAQDEKVTGAIDDVLTFAELDEMLTAQGIDLAAQEEEQTSGPKPYMGRMYAVPGGWLRAADLSTDIMKNEVVAAEGKEQVVKIVQELAQGNIKARFLELLFCQGCINGPFIPNDLSFFKRKEVLINYTLDEADPAQTERDLAQYAGVDLGRRFTTRYTALPIPSEEEITGMLARINKAKPGDELNCGACGYHTCRELATRVSQGLAEVEMCWPYLLDRLEADQNQLIQAEKLTSLGQMAAAIAHEINNPLAGVLTYTQLLAKKVASQALDKEAGLGYLAKMESELTRTSRMIRNLLDFARQSEPVLRPVDINQVIEQAFSLLGHQAELQKVKLVKEFDTTLPKVTADFEQLRQIFVNLILNAVQAMPAGGTLTLRTALVNNNQLKIDVQDTGCGIPPENLSKLFTPFFTTKGKGKGVGLGLAVVFGIVHRHEGRIEVKSVVGKGSTFTIYLGVHREEKG